MEWKFKDEKGNEWVAKWDGTGTAGGAMKPGGRIPNDKARIFFECLTDPKENCDTFIPFKKANALEATEERELQRYLEQAIRERNREKKTE